MELVFRYGVASWWQPPAEIMQQLRLAHQLGNQLVEIANWHEQAKAAHWSSFPEIAAAERDTDTADDAVRQARESVALCRQKAGWHKYQGNAAEARQWQDRRREAAAELAAARSRLAAAKLLRRDGITGRLGESEAALAALEQQRREKVAALYAPYCQRDGLHHGSFGTVVRHHETARSRVAAARGSLQPGQLRFRRWDGTGSVTVVLMRSAWSHGCADSGPPWPCAGPGRARSKPGECPARRPKDPRRSPELLASGGGKWGNVFQLRPWTSDSAGWRARPESQRRGTAVLTLSHGRRFEVPVLVDRMLPPGADIPRAELVCSEQAGQKVWHLCVTATVPDPEPVDCGPVVAVHLGWRRRRDGHIRVAVIRSDRPLPPPPDELLRPASTSPGRKADASAGAWKPHYRPHLEQHGDWWEVVIPAKLWHVVGRPAVIGSDRMAAFHLVRDRLAGWVEQHPEQAEVLGVELARVKAWNAGGPAKLAALVRRWDPSPKARERGAQPPPDLPADFAAVLLPDLVAWWRRDLHLLRNQRGEHDDLRRRRDDAYRQVGAWLARCAGRVVVGDEQYRQLRRRPDETAERGPVMATTRQEEAVRARASYASPGLLRQMVAWAATRDGVPVAKVPSKGLTREHAVCGFYADPQTYPTDRYAQGVMVTCPGCGGAYDQDQNAAGLMLARERSATTDAPR